MNAKKERIVQAIRKRAKEITPRGSEIILFGSQARNSARSDSDWDVLILLDRERIRLNDYDEYSYPLRELGWDYDTDINTILYTKKDWERDVATPFHENVARDGIRL